MTREEAIIEAGIEYSIQNSPYCIGGDNFYEKARELNRNKSFEAGVIWADKNPKSPWISVDDDLPCNHSELLDPENTAVKMETIPVLTGISFNIFSVGWMEKRQGKWVWHSTIEPQYWMPIPKLPKNSE